MSEPTEITVTMTFCDEDGSYQFIDKMLKAIDQDDCVTLANIKVERGEDPAGTAGTFFSCEGPARNVRPMVAGVAQSK